MLQPETAVPSRHRGLRDSHDSLGLKGTGFPGGTVLKKKKKKNLPANARDAGDTGSIPDSRRSPGGGNGHPLWYSCLENPMDRGACRAIVHGVTKSRTGLSTHTKRHQVLSFWEKRS